MLTILKATDHPNESTPVTSVCNIDSLCSFSICFKDTEMTFDKGEMDSDYFKPFLFRIPSAWLWEPDAFVPYHSQHQNEARWGFLILEEMSGEGVKCHGPWRVSLTCTSLCARPFNPELHPSAVLWQWQDITKISSDCWGVWHLSLVMKYRKSTCPCCRFSNSKALKNTYFTFTAKAGAVFEKSNASRATNSATYHLCLYFIPPWSEEIIMKNN